MDVSTRWRLPAALAVTLMVALTAVAEPLGTRASHAATRPNIVVIMTDDHSENDATAGGTWLDHLPKTKRLLADQGTTFVNSYATYSWCCPSRATLLTGQYPHNHGVLSNSLPDGGYPKLRGGQTLPVWLKNAGYRTAHIGKYLNGYMAGVETQAEVDAHPQRHIPPGWTDWWGAPGWGTYKMWGHWLNANGVLMPYGQQDGDPQSKDPVNYQPDVYARIATRFLDQHAPSAAPFMLSIAPASPHGEIDVKRGDGTTIWYPRPAPRHVGRYATAELPRDPNFNEADVSDKPRHIRELNGGQPISEATVNDRMTVRYRNRLEALLAIDDLVEQVVNRLAALGELDDTLIVFASDNGFLQGAHRVVGDKIHPYEDSIRVPLVMRGPGMAANRRFTEPVANIDLAPTILDAANVTAGIPMDGHSLFQTATLPDPRGVLVETGPRTDGSRWYQAIRGERYLYVEHSTGERELYDLQVDPHQLDSRHDDPALAAVRQDLTTRLHFLRDCGKAGKPVCPGAAGTDPDS
ncbi:sulfatase family protein [Thermomonospora umbrina]|uniref:Arylsulfatase A-like enzyme n=1 Tax=Thermomonospora umbrina TaxID=111806 RepID=A0A3D9SNS2_9ACTN|nr:sulfatase [Thermomonospora umbrina]REE97626.1 arylsulfatase A-like enzyme [Thermomonospora umbrina]